MVLIALLNFCLVLAGCFDFAESIDLGSEILSMDITVNNQILAVADSNKVNIIRKSGETLSVLYTLDDGDTPRYVEFSADGIYLYVVWQQGLGIMYKLNPSSVYATFLTVNALIGGASFTGAMRFDAKKLVLCESSLFRVYDVDLTAISAAQVYSSQFDPQNIFSTLQISMAAIVPGFILLGVYRNDANSTLQAFFDNTSTRIAGVPFRKFPKLRLKNDFTSFILDPSKLNNLGTIQYAGHNIQASVSNDEKLIVVSSSQKIYITEGAFEGQVTYPLEESVISKANIPSFDSRNVYFGKVNGELVRYFDCRSVGQFYKYNVDNKQCEACIQNCITCLSQTECQICDENNGFGLDKDNQCILCDSSQDFFIIDHVCEKCSIAFCLDCFNFTSCLQCNTNLSYYQQSGECVLCNSSNNQFLNNGRCQKCQLTNCQVCQNLNECSRCTNGYFLENSTCFLCEMEGCAECLSQSSCKSCRIDDGYNLNQRTKTCQLPPPVIPLSVTLGVLVVLTIGGLVVYNLVASSPKPLPQNQIQSQQKIKENI